jgi:hypothetical protein
VDRSSTNLVPRLRSIISPLPCVTGAAIWAVMFTASTWVWNGPAGAQTVANSASSSAPATTKTTPSEREDSVPDLSGFWEMRDDSGSGSFTGLSQKVPPAAITPEVKKINAEAKARQEAGYVVSFGSRYCQYLGMPFIMGQSPPIDIVQAKGEILIMSEQASAARHIYTDGRGHPDPSTYEPTTNGHSIGHWEGNTLEVDTVGFNEFGARGVPGGGLRTPTSHLVERFRLLDGGKRLSITFTWNDPKVYLKPHTYGFVYYKDAPDTYAYEDFCDAGDPAQGQSVIPPPQQ